MTSEDRDLSIFLDEDQEGSRSSASPEGGSAKGGKSGRSGRGLPVWQESILLLVLAVVIAVIIKSFFVQAFFIPSASMEPGLQGGPGTKTDDRVLVEKPSYWGSGTPRRGDIVVFSDPGGWLSSEETQSTTGISKLLSHIGLVPAGGHLVKRVIGVAGDVISVNKKGQITVNGKALDESSYARPADHACGTSDPGTCYGPMPNVAHWKAGPVPPGYLFVMGDNRNNSADSSYHLCTKAETDCSDSPWVPVKDVVGKVVSLVWPAGRAHIIHRPATFDDVPSP